MSYRAWIYIWIVYLAGMFIGAASLLSFTPSSSLWLTFGILTLLATLAQLFKAEAPSHVLYHATPIFLFVGVLLLPPFLFVLMVVIAFLVEWLKERLIDSPHLRAWYLQPFNIAMYIVVGFSAHCVYSALDADRALYRTQAAVSGVALAALTYVALNHFLLGLALILARRKSWRESAVLDTQNLLTELILLCLGYLVAIHWYSAPWLILPVLAPLVLIYQALTVPQLKQEAQTDVKTGLLNARHYTKRFHEELDRAQRFGRPLAVIMADLDLLRDINNTYGHLAGDSVLTGIGGVIRGALRDYDIAGRFGGEEFAIVLLEADRLEAQMFAERLRRTIAETRFAVASSAAPISVTMSMGIACFPADGLTPDELMHKADVAVYQAKIGGRNRVVCAVDVPHSAELEQVAPNAAVGSDYRAAFIPLPSSACAAAEASAPAAVQPVDAARDPADTLAIEEQAPLDDSGVPGARREPRLLMALFIGGVIAAGAGVAVFGATIPARLDPGTLGLLLVLAVIAELLQVDLYGQGTISVSLAITFAAALIGGIGGVAWVGAAIAVGAALALARTGGRRPVPYKIAFNWACHVLAGSAPVFAFGALGLQLHIANLPLLLFPAALAAIVYFLIETWLISVAIGLSTNTRPATIWRERYRWLASHYLLLCGMGLFLSIAYASLGLAGVIVFVLPIFTMRYAQKQYVERTEDSVRELQRMNQELAQANREIVDASRSIRQLNGELHDLNDELFLTLAKIFDARDPYVGGHADQVASYATAIAQELGLSGERLEHIRQAGYLHDIGKIAIPEAILHKPGQLTNQEYTAIQTHAALGAEFLMTSRGLRHLAAFVRYHHERWDGHGYPDGLRGEEIPLEARILNVCDSVEAMASDRPYHKGMALAEILGEIRRCTGTQFDPVVAEAFIRLAERRGEAFVVNSARQVVRKQAVKNQLVPAEGDGRIQANATSAPLASMAVQSGLVNRTNHRHGADLLEDGLLA